MSSPPSPAPRPRKPFLLQSYGDMLRSLIVLAVLVGAAYGCSAWLEADQETPVHTVDYSSDLRSARATADYDVLAPRDLPPGWRATSADLEETARGVSWSLGFLTPQDRYVGLEQSDAELDASIRQLIQGRQPVSTVEVGGRRWDVYARAGDTALVHVDGDVTTAIVSPAGLEAMTTFAAALR